MRDGSFWPVPKGVSAELALKAMLVLTMIGRLACESDEEIFSSHAPAYAGSVVVFDQHGELRRSDRSVFSYADPTVIEATERVTARHVTMSELLWVALGCSGHAVPQNLPQGSRIYNPTIPRQPLRPEVVTYTS